MFNVDGTKNSAGNITHLADIIIDYQGHCEKVTAEVMDLGKNQVILGYTWLKKYNPDINWTNGEAKMTRCPHSCYILQEKSIFLQTLEKEEVEQAWSAHKIRVMLDNVTLSLGKDEYRPYRVKGSSCSEGTGGR